MSYQVLSRKWRPKRFEEVVGQAHVTRSLQSSIAHNKLGHAYVFTGTRGIGKTSIARLFAKSLRCLDRQEGANPCGKCQSCLDFHDAVSMNIVELDGASNNSVDDIRNLIGNVQTLPTFGHYKIYIIDEVHMLSISAFNALLKTLEEPPAHVIFLMATTEPHKIPDTVLSRCQRFDFRNASPEILEQHLKDIASKEDIKFADATLPRLIASQGQGSFRDTLSLMDQVLSFSDDKEIDEDIVSLALGTPKSSSIRKLMMAILSENAREVSAVFNELLFNNITLDNISKSLLDMIYDVIQSIDHLDPQNYSSSEREVINGLKMDEVFWIFEGLTKDIKWSIESLSPNKSLEIVLQKYALRSQLLSSQSVSIEKKKTEDISPSETETRSEEVKVEPQPVKEETPAVHEPAVEEAVQESTSESLDDIESETTEEAPAPVVEEIDPTWENFEIHLRAEAPALSAQLLHGNVIELESMSEDLVSVRYGFSQSSKVFYDHLTQEKTKEKIEPLMVSFFKTHKAVIKFELIDEKESFASKADLIEEEHQNIKEEKLNDFKNHPVIKEAEKLFGSSLDKIRVKE